MCLRMQDYCSLGHACFNCAYACVCLHARQEGRKGGYACMQACMRGLHAYARARKSSAKMAFTSGRPTVSWCQFNYCKPLAPAVNLELADSCTFTQPFANMTTVAHPSISSLARQLSSCATHAAMPWQLTNCCTTSPSASLPDKAPGCMPSSASCQHAACILFLSPLAHLPHRLSNTSFVLLPQQMS